ncbi:uncharacterized protein KY384_006285 [Bacidia gigantensis]|uniref:uncharacterized protein n=1 Tax=Bacidia gigantensis TaxID=2732470 RepID=UPI001D059BA3|nr:uncharacterized protein KY384_006285 [Bacidia gigantensis]KAG8528598.1 hypothetical protein KY384_006285 [Bacidia gigantensis]
MSVRVIVIDPQGDVHLHLYVQELIKNDAGTFKRTIDELLFQVSKATMMRYSSRVKDALRTNSNDIYAASSKGVEILLRILHGQNPTVGVDISGVWHAIVFRTENYFSPTILNDWYAGWYKLQPIEQNFREWIRTKPEDQNWNPRCFLFPSWHLNDAVAFLEVTHFLVYNVARYISEERPIKAQDKYRLDNQVIQQLNAARGRLRSIAFNILFNPMERILATKKSCCESAAGDYHRALVETGSWPWERLGNSTPMNTLLKQLGDFSYQALGETCGRCRLDYEDVVEACIHETNIYFDGLCLDCMDASNPKTESSDRDYWKHSTMSKGEFLTGCRVKLHGEATWYHSFMGRREDFDRLRQEAKTENARELGQGSQTQPRRNRKENTQPNRRAKYQHGGTEYRDKGEPKWHLKKKDTEKSKSDESYARIMAACGLSA